MDDKLQNELKYKLVRRVMSKVLPAYQGRLQTGLIAFGHKQANSCKDITRVLPLKNHKKKTFSQALNTIRPKGKSPISASLMNAIAMVNSAKTPLHMLLIADGSDNCGANICASAKFIAKRSPQTKIHVIGLGNTSSARRLSCVSDATNGIFASIKNKSKMTTALNRILRAVLTKPAVQPLLAMLGPPPLPATKTPLTIAPYTEPVLLATVPLPVRSLLKSKIIKLMKSQASAKKPQKAPKLVAKPLVVVAKKKPQPIKAATKPPVPAPPVSAPIEWQQITEKPMLISETGQLTKAAEQPKPKRPATNCKNYCRTTSATAPPKGKACDQFSGQQTANRSQSAGKFSTRSTRRLDRRTRASD